MKTRILNIGIIFCSVILFSAFITGCSKLKAGDTFTATTDGVEYQYEVIVSRMNYVRVVPVSGNLSGIITIPSPSPKRCQSSKHRRSPGAFLGSPEFSGTKMNLFYYLFER